MNTLLVIVDLQKGFLNETTKHIVDKIKELVKTKKFNHIVASQFINVKNSPFQRLMSWFDLQKAEEIALDPLVLDVAEKIFQKDIYSCWTCEFEKYVKENEIDEIYFCGVDTDACVLKSAVDTFERNIDVKVIVNCCASTGGIDSHRAGLLVLGRLIGKKNILEKRRERGKDELIKHYLSLTEEKQIQFIKDHYLLDESRVLDFKRDLDERLQ